MSIERVSSGNSIDIFQEAVTELGGDPQARAALMLLSYAHDSRAAGRAARAEQEEQLRSLEAAEVSELRAQAHDVRNAALMRGVGQAANGVTMMVASGLQAHSAVKARPAPGETPGTISSAPREAPSTAKPVLTSAPGFLNGGGKAVEAAGGITGAVFEERGALANADAKSAEHRAEAVKQRIATLSEDVGDARDLARTALDFLRDASDAEAEANRAALFARV